MVGILGRAVCRPVFDLNILIISILIYTASAAISYESRSGCSDGSIEGFQDSTHPSLSACAGSWEGHVENASALCGRGWHVCTHHDRALLHRLSWKDARSISGCYAYNAAQDGGKCQACINYIEQDDMAGIGSDCIYQSEGTKSCINGGKMDASCCVDSTVYKACNYRPGITSGVLCCKEPGVAPLIIVRPRELTHVTSGVTFVLSCQAVGSPQPSVTWWKEKEKLPNNESRISVFESGYMLISNANPRDSGMYTCLVENNAGRDKAVASIIVTEYESGCEDGTTDGLTQYEDIQACRGEWDGHVKRARGLCARGWKVCNQRHIGLIKLLTWSDVTELAGCYAYNAANTLNSCTRCHPREDMAGIGAGCGRIHRTYSSCLAQGRIDVYKGRKRNGCAYTPGHTSGVLCCKKQQKDTNMWVKPPKCTPKCINGGKCVRNNQCECPAGYKGAWCQNAVCEGDCIPHATCVRPGVCKCNAGYRELDNKCRKKHMKCKQPCFNGGKCRYGQCKCSDLYWGQLCQYVKWRPLPELNRTER